MKQTLCISFLAIIATLILTSAQKKDRSINHVTQVSHFKFNKYITVTDSKKTCNITLKVSGNNGQELTDYSTNNFIIEPVFKAEEAPQATLETAAETVETEAPVFIERAFEVVGESLPEGAVGFKVTFADLKAPCKYRGFWGHSGFKTITIDKTITGPSINNLVYSSACGVNTWNRTVPIKQWGCAVNSFQNSTGVGGIGVNISPTLCDGIRSITVTNKCTK